jgi:hypothetical protein
VAIGTSSEVLEQSKELGQKLARLYAVTKTLKRGEMAKVNSFDFGST